MIGSIPLLGNKSTTLVAVKGLKRVENLALFCPTNSMETGAIRNCGCHFSTSAALK